MRTKAKLVVGSLALFTLFTAGASAQSFSEDKASRHQRERSKRISAAIPRIEKALKVRRDGTVDLDERRPAHRKLSDSERALGKALAHGLNARIRAGELSINQDLKIQRLFSAARPELPVGFREANVSCDSHWWGEECDIDLSTTQQIYDALEVAGDLSQLCEFIPEVDAACHLLDVLFLAPAEEDFLGCINRGEGLEFSITWIGVPSIDCQ